jgi:predicted ribosome quality control (RQC) complex YloA/Tae2 family protein
MANMYGRNMLDKKMYVADEVEHMMNKRELTSEDFDRLIANAHKLERAAEIAKDLKFGEVKKEKA